MDRAIVRSSTTYASVFFIRNNELRYQNFSVCYCCYFGPFLLWPYGCMYIRIPIGTEVGLSLGDTSLKGHNPLQSSANVRCGQTVGWTKIPLAMEVSLGPGDFVFDGDPCSSFPRKKAQPPPHFWPMSIVAKRLDGSRCHLVLVRGKPRPRPHCVRLGPSSPAKGAHQPPLFGPCL